MLTKKMLALEKFKQQLENHSASLLNLYGESSANTGVTSVAG